MSGKASSARDMALQILLQCGSKEGFVQQLLDQHLSNSSLSGPDRRLVTQLVYGVLRRRGTLDALLQVVVDRPVEKVETRLWELLRLGVYQLILLEQIPGHAAVYETVKLAEQGGRGAKGFVNGVLRSLDRLLTEERTQVPDADAVPLENGIYRKLTRAVLPAPDAHRVGYLSAAFGLPGWLMRRWLERFGWDECLRLGFWFASPAPLWLRINPLRTTRATYLDLLRQSDMNAEAGQHPQAIRLDDFVPVRELPGFAGGHCTVQDESAMRVASAVSPAPGSKVLDLCAAPGGKTTHLAELMQNRGSILACDIDARRLENVATTARRLGLDIVETKLLAKNERAPAGPFDAVLVDVPCSNTGVLGRRPEVRWRLRAGDVARLVTQQKQLLHAACERVRPGGTVVYSSCSIEPEENQGVVHAVLEERGDMTVEAEAEQLPGRPADGGYWARLTRKGN